MKSILLVIPKGNGVEKNKRWNREWPDTINKSIENNLWKIVTPGPLVIANLTDKEKFSVELIDEEFQTIEDKYYDIVAFYLVTPNANRGYSLAKHFKSKGAHIVLGGVHPTVLPDEAEKHGDTIITGEAEKTWQQFLIDYQLGAAKKRYTQPLGTINLKESPVPAFNLIPGNARNLIPVQTTRGCPHGCKFCNLRSLYGNQYRTKDIEQVKKEIESVRQLNPKSRIYFTDDNFFCNKERSKSMLDLFNHYKFIWYTNTDISFGEHESLVKQAYNCGCRQILVGFESLNSANLQGTDMSNFKMKHLKQYKELITKIQSNGIGIVGSFILGLTNDNKDTFKKIKDFILETNLYGISLTINTPYPGTEFFEQAKKENAISSYNWDDYTIFQPLMKTNELTLDQLNYEYIELLKEIHSPANIANRTKYMITQYSNLESRK